MTRIIVDVTQDHIDRGRKGVSNLCPIALAIPNPDPTRSVYVEHRFVAFQWEDSGCVCVDIPESAARFVRDFDDGEEVSPFSFELDVPGHPIEEATG